MLEAHIWVQRVHVRPPFIRTPRKSRALELFSTKVERSVKKRSVDVKYQDGK